MIVVRNNMKFYETSLWQVSLISNEMMKVRFCLSYDHILDFTAFNVELKVMVL